MAEFALNGYKLLGGGSKESRIENDYYATNPKAVRMLLERYELKADTILEPCVGEGHIANTVKEFYGNKEVVGIDIVDRGYPGTIICDFLKWDPDREYMSIITNPPYSLAQEFTERCMEILGEGGQLCQFLRIQFLETVRRKALFEKYPPKYVYVFSKRMPVFSDGREIDPQTGKVWATTLCNAWFVWEKGSKTETVIRWL